MADLSPPENPDQNGNNPFWVNGLPKQIRSKVRVQKRTGCWLWQGTIRPARQRQRLSRYVSRVYDTFGDPCRLEFEAALPEVWDGRKGAKVAAHRFVRSVLTCTPIDEVPRLSRCHDPRCVSPFHNLEIGPPVATRKPARTVAPVPSIEIGVDVLAVLKERNYSTSFQAPDDFPSIENDCDLPPGSLTMAIWTEYVQWDMKENPDDY